LLTARRTQGFFFLLFFAPFFLPLSAHFDKDERRCPRKIRKISMSLFPLFFPLSPCFVRRRRTFGNARETAFSSCGYAVCFFPSFSPLSLGRRSTESKGNIERPPHIQILRAQVVFFFPPSLFPESIERALVSVVEHPSNDCARSCSSFFFFSPPLFSVVIARELLTITRGFASDSRTRTYAASPFFPLRSKTDDAPIVVEHRCKIPIRERYADFSRWYTFFFPFSSLLSVQRGNMPVPTRSVSGSKINALTEYAACVLSPLSPLLSQDSAGSPR